MIKKSVGISDESIKEIIPVGGMTNKNFKVKIDDKQYIIRIPGNGTEEMISRKSEKHNSLIANKLNIDTDILYFNDINGIKLSKYINNAETINPKTAKREDNMLMVADILKKLHTSNTLFDNEFNVFKKIEEYEKLLDLCKGKNYSDYNEVKEQVIKLEEKLNQIGFEIKPCHNDTVAENFVKDKERMYLIDWEYSGMNDPMWDIAAHILECEFNEDEEELFLSIYFNNEVKENHRARILIYKICQDFLWSIWTNIKESKGDDFGSYGQDRYNRAKLNLKKINW